MVQKENKSWFKKQVTKVQFLPWYWKSVLSIAVFLAGGIFGAWIVNCGNDALLMLGSALLVIALWFVIQLWWSEKDE